jgi:adenylate cyclase
VNGKLLAATSDHPAPQLKAESGETTIKQEGRKLFAAKTFKPKALQRPGLVVEVTASRDVTQLHDEKRSALLLHLAGLGAVLRVVLGLALRFAGRLGSTVKGISDAAEQVKLGKYVSAPVIRIGDELESLAAHFNDMVRGLEERDRLRETFGRYVTRQVADHLMKGNINLGGDLVPVTVLGRDKEVMVYRLIGLRVAGCAQVA